MTINRDINDDVTNVTPEQKTDIENQDVINDDVTNVTPTDLPGFADSGQK